MKFFCEKSEQLRTNLKHIGIYLLKFNNKNTRLKCDQNDANDAIFHTRSSVVIVNFKHVIAGWKTCVFARVLTLFVPITDEEKKLTWIFYLHHKEVWK